MGQSRQASWLEVSLNVGSGFILSLIVWQYFVSPLFDIPIPVTSNIGITAIFTAVSLLRSYCWRRAAEWWQQNYTNQGEPKCPS